MTPEQIRLNGELPNVDAFKEVTKEVSDLKAGQNKIIGMIEDNEEEAKREFEKGSSMFKDLYGKVEAMDTKMDTGFNKIFKLIVDHIEESKDNKITKLTSETQDLREELKSKKTRSEAVKDGVIIVLVGGILLALCGYGLSLIGITVPK